MIKPLKIVTELLESINTTLGRNHLGRTTALGLIRQRQHIGIKLGLHVTFSMLAYIILMNAGLTINDNPDI